MRILSKEIKKFENQFMPETTELIVLVKKNLGGAMVVGKYCTPNLCFVAAVNPVTNELYQAEGILTWIIKQNKGLRCKMKGMKIYRVLVRKCSSKLLGENISPAMNNKYLLVKILKKNVHDERLEEIRDEYKKPVYIDDSIGHFTLNRDYDWFNGEIDWLGEKCSVYLNVESGALNADSQLEKLKAIVANLAEWDNKVRKFAAADLTDLANDWQGDEEKASDITDEQFAKRIGMPSLVGIGTDNCVEFSFDDDNMFFGHTIVVRTNEMDELECADIEG